MLWVLCVEKCVEVLEGWKGGGVNPVETLLLPRLSR